MLLPKLTWLDPGNLAYDRIEIFRKVNGGNPVDPADLYVDVAIGEQEYVDPGTYNIGDIVCYGLKSVVTHPITGDIKSAFTPIICVSIGVLTAAATQLTITAYNVVVNGNFPKTGAPDAASLRIRAHAPLVVGAEAPVVPGVDTLVMTAYAAGLSEHGDLFTPGTTAVSITSSSATLQKQAFPIVVPREQVALNTFAAVMEGFAPENFLPGADSVGVTAYGATVASLPTGFIAGADILTVATQAASMTKPPTTLSAGQHALTLITYAATLTPSGIPAGADVDVTGQPDVDITGQPDVDGT